MNDVNQPKGLIEKWKIQSCPLIHNLTIWTSNRLGLDQRGCSTSSTSSTSSSAQRQTWVKMKAKKKWNLSRQTKMLELGLICFKWNSCYQALRSIPCGSLDGVVPTRHVSLRLGSNLGRWASKVNSGGKAMLRGKIEEDDVCGFCWCWWWWWLQQLPRWWAKTRTSVIIAAGSATGVMLHNPKAPRRSSDSNRQRNKTFTSCFDVFFCRIAFLLGGSKHV